ETLLPIQETTGHGAESYALRLGDVLFVPVSKEFLKPDVRERMLNELPEYCYRHRANVPADLRGLHDVLRMSDAGDQHFRLVLVVGENGDDVSDRLRLVVADIGFPVYECSYA